MGDKIKILVTKGSDLVSVRWLLPFDRIGGGAYRALENTLSELDGVEKVYMRRYSADVEIASHVASEKEVAEAIVEALNDRDSEFRYALRFSMTDPEVEVSSV